MKYFYIFLLYIFISPQTVLAQSIENFSMELDPQYPKEYSAVSVSLESFATDLDRAQIVWREDGQIIDSGTGIKTKRFITKGNGVQQEISVEVTTLSGYILRKAISLTPQTMDILWEASDSYVPPFYKGKALPGEQSVLRVVAVPNFTINGIPVNRKEIVYNWTHNETGAELSSGFGRSFFAFMFDPLKKTESVRVVASTKDGFSSTQETVYITPQKSEILVYEETPLLGVLYDKAFMGGVRLTIPEMTLVAEPFFFSGRNRIQNALSYTWSINNTITTNEKDPRKITVRRGEGKGEAQIDIAITHPKKILQEAFRSIPVLFGEQ